MLNKTPVKIIRNWKISLKESGNKFSANGYIDSDENFKRHDVYVYDMKKNGKSVPFEFEDSEEYYVGSSYGKSIDEVFKDITNMIENDEVLNPKE